MYILIELTVTAFALPPTLPPYPPCKEQTQHISSMLISAKPTINHSMSQGDSERCVSVVGGLFSQFNHMSSLTAEAT